MKGGPSGAIQKTKSRIVPKKSGAKVGSLVCFRCGRVFFSFRFGRASEVGVVEV